MLSMGTYPDTPLAEARNQREAARQSLAKGTACGLRNEPRAQETSVQRHRIDDREQVPIDEIHRLT